MDPTIFKQILDAFFGYAEGKSNSVFLKLALKEVNVVLDDLLVQWLATNPAILQQLQAKK